MRKVLKNIIRLLGFDIHRHGPRTAFIPCLVEMLHVNNIDTVLDVGANNGQFAIALRREGFSGKIVSFEPLPAAHKALTQKAEGDSGWVIAPPMAIGASEGERELNISGNIVSSSLLDMNNYHLEAAPNSEYIDHVTVRVSTLEEQYTHYCSKNSRVFLKLDVQGYEGRILSDMDSYRNRIDGIQVELSTAELYRGQETYLSLLRRLEKSGYHLHLLEPGLRSDETCRLLQFDAVLFRK